MHTRTVKIKNGIPTIVAHHEAGGDRLYWNGHKWVIDVPYTFSVNQMLRSVIKTEEK